eukprot:9496250-Pyramimonas_sp.AAC.5
MDVGVRVVTSHFFIGHRQSALPNVWPQPRYRLHSFILSLKFKLAYSILVFRLFPLEMHYPLVIHTSHIAMSDMG